MFGWYAGGGLTRRGFSTVAASGYGLWVGCTNGRCLGPRGDTRERRFDLCRRHLSGVVLISAGSVSCGSSSFRTVVAAALGTVFTPELSSYPCAGRLIRGACVVCTDLQCARMWSFVAVACPYIRVLLVATCGGLTWARRGSEKGHKRAASMQVVSACDWVLLAAASELLGLQGLIVVQTRVPGCASCPTPTGESRTHVLWPHLLFCVSCVTHGRPHTVHATPGVRPCASTLHYMSTRLADPNNWIASTACAPCCAVCCRAKATVGVPGACLSSPTPAHNALLLTTACCVRG
jgi:hypothetical protein